MSEADGPPNTEQPWFVPVLLPQDDAVDGHPTPGDDAEDDAEDDASGPIEVPLDTELTWSPWAIDERIPERLVAAVRALALRLTGDLPELSHRNPGGGERFEHAQLIAALSHALGAVVELCDGRSLSGDDLAMALGSAHDGAVIAAIIAEATGEPGVALQSAWLRRTGEEVQHAMWRRFHPVGDGRFRVRLRRGERALLHRVVAEQQQRLDEDGPALAPLFPPGYGDGDAESSERSAEFASLTRNDLTASRGSALELVESSLELRVIDAETLAAWMRTLNDIRLVMATELEITDDAQAPPAPWDASFPTWRTYAVLGNLVHETVLALRTQL